MYRKPQVIRVAMPETDVSSGIRLGKSGHDLELMNRGPRAGRPGLRSRSMWVPILAILAALFVSGCRTTPEYSADHPFAPSKATTAGATIAVPTKTPLSRDAVTVARLQSPAAEPAQEPAAPVQTGLPPLPDPSLPATASVGAQPPASPPPADDTAAGRPDPAASVLAPAAGAVVDRNWPAPRGASSIARNRLANRRGIAPVSNPDGSLDGSPSRATSSGPANPRTGGMSSILRNRVQGEAGGEGPQFDFPDIRADPPNIYRDRFGLVDEEHDRFLFPWLMNLIFEDRWLLDESDPTRPSRTSCAAG